MAVCCSRQPCCDCMLIASLFASFSFLLCWGLNQGLLHASVLLSVSSNEGKTCSEEVLSSEQFSRISKIVISKCGLCLLGKVVTEDMDVMLRQLSLVLCHSPQPSSWPQPLRVDIRFCVSQRE